MKAIEELSYLLRPAAGGLYLVSTGREEQLQIQRHLYRAASEKEVQTRFLASLEKIASAKIVILGVPSDVGAGFLRGANTGPQAIRQELLRENPDWPESCEEKGILDIGDVFVVPQLLHDDMLQKEQKAASQRALYPTLSSKEASRLPVSPLSIEERILDLVFSLNPKIKPFVLGGDHSTAWPVASALSRAKSTDWGIVQPDAHTDLLEERLGIRYCFATWSYHANELLGRGEKLVQVGIRASRFGRKHWEDLYQVRQFWAETCVKQPEKALDDIIAHVKKTKVNSIYFSNDIDGTDASFANATGTPEPDGLSPDFVVTLIQRLGKEVGLCAGDIMEVAPPIQRTPDGAKKTVALATRYMKETLEALLLS